MPRMRSEWIVSKLSRSSSNFFMDHKIPAQNMHLRFTAALEDSYQTCPSACVVDDKSVPKQYLWSVAEMHSDFALRFQYSPAKAIVFVRSLKAEPGRFHSFRRSSDDFSQVPSPYSKGIFERRRGGKALFGQVEEHVSFALSRKIILSVQSVATLSYFKGIQPLRRFKL